MNGNGIKYQQIADQDIEEQGSNEEQAAGGSQGYGDQDVKCLLRHLSVD